MSQHELFSTPREQDSLSPHTPLAERMRPRDLQELVGQEEVVGPGTSLRSAIENDLVGSLIFWGPPGSGKTTLARIIARRTNSHFISYSAGLSGIKEIKAVMQEAAHYRKLQGRRTILFVDEMVRSPAGKADYRWARCLALERLGIREQDDRGGKFSGSG